MQYTIVVLAFLALIFLVQTNFTANTAGRVLPVLIAAFVARLVIHVTLMRGSTLWYGGDNLAYESKAMDIVEVWSREGIHLVLPGDELKSVALPCNLFAAIIYLCGEKASLACVAVVALMACALCIIMYRLARLLGANERAAFILLVLTAFTPGFLVHTSDTFKDGFNAFLVVACLGLACSNVKRFDLRKVVLLAPLLWALWHVRPYMVFMCAPPLIMSVVCFHRKPSMRIVALLAMVPILVLAVVEGAGAAMLEAVQEQLEYAQSSRTLLAVAADDSGITFDSTDPWSNMGLKILYTLLAPFPWTGGNLTLQFGKIETLICYYLLYSAVRGARALWRDNRAMLLVLLLFIVPSVIAYATTVANIGLIFRQRMPIVMIYSLLAAVGWSVSSRKGAETQADQGGDRRTGTLRITSTCVPFARHGVTGPKSARRVGVRSSTLSPTHDKESETPGKRAR